MNDKSRVSREAQARFREGLGVKLPGATGPSTDPTRWNGDFGLNGKLPRGGAFFSGSVAAAC
jgi:hypothetical protein